LPPTTAARGARRGAGWWNKPKAPMLAVPLNMTAGYAVWRSMDAALKWTNEW
jgi:hypothetical protein